LEVEPLAPSDIAARCREIGALDDIVPSLFDTDLDAIDDVVSLTDGIWTTRAGMVARLDRLLADRVFTHRLTSTEHLDHAVALDPDLTVLDADVDAMGVALTLIDGNELTVDIPGIGETGRPVVTGPSGWLDEFAPGDLIAFAKELEGSVDVFYVDTINDGHAEAAAIRDGFDAVRRDPDAGYDVWPILIDALASDADLFTTPVRPIDELLESVGLEHRDGYIGPDDAAWLPAGVVFANKLRAQVAEVYGFDVCCHVAFETITDAWDWNLGIPAGEPDAVAAAKALGHERVSAAFISWIQARGGDLIDIASFFESIGERAGRHGALPLERAAWIWFTDGSVADAIEDANAAITLDPNATEATILLGHVAAIRGDYGEALRLLRRSNPADVWIGNLEEIFEPFPDAKRNDPCPCGSGSKFKVCCARTPKVTPIERMHLLTHKILAFLHTVRSERLHYLGRIAASADDRNDPNDIERFVAHPFLIQIAAIDDSLDFFAALWGPLLPQDERDTIDLWRASTRAVWEVTDEPEGPYITLRDTRTGDTVTVYDETGAPHLHTGTLLMGIVAPAFGEDRFLADPLTIDLRHRDMTLALFDETPTPEELAHWFGLVTAPPRLQTTEGQDMVACRAVCEPTLTWESLTAELDTRYECDEGAEDTWETTFVNDAGEKILRGTLRKEGAQLIIETMSQERLDDILDTLTQVTVVEETREPVTIPSALEPRPHDETATRKPPDPEVRAMLDEIMQQKEEAWLDEQIPLLNGLTPRQAAADPTRRNDLIALLDSFTPAEGEAMTGFNAERLRRLLGLE
ncbi:hypothetical protein MNBD_ACTINO01-1518, partial [hydrothermal vent metagenome]